MSRKQSNPVKIPHSAVSDLGSHCMFRPVCHILGLNRVLEVQIKFSFSNFKRSLQAELFITLLLGSKANSVKYKTYIQTKMYRLYRKMIINGHFPI